MNDEAGQPIGLALPVVFVLLTGDVFPEAITPQNRTERHVRCDIGSRSGSGIRNLGNEAGNLSLPSRDLSVGVAAEIDPVRLFRLIRLPCADDHQAADIKARRCQQLEGRLCLTCELDCLRGSQYGAVRLSVERAGLRAQRQLVGT